MARTADMFADLKPPRQAPRKLMHVFDAAGPCDEELRGAMVRMYCSRCGYESPWLDLPSVTAAKRGLPCPTCSAAASMSPDLAAGGMEGVRC